MKNQKPAPLADRTAFGDNPITEFFFANYRKSPKTWGLLNLLKVLSEMQADSVPFLHAVEYGIQRDFSKMSLFTDGWSSTAFLASNAVSNVIGIDTDTTIVSSLSDMVDDEVGNKYVLIKGRMEAVGPLEIGTSESFYYFDGPNDSRITNDVLGYVLPHLTEICTERKSLGVILLDDVEYKCPFFLKTMENYLLGVDASKCTGKFSRIQHTLKCRHRTGKFDYEIDVGIVVLDGGKLDRGGLIHNTYLNALTSVKSVNLSACGVL